MIVKQNCFVVSKDEQTSLLNGSFKHRQIFDLKGNLIDAPTSYTGSSLIRVRKKPYEPSITRSSIDLPFEPNKLHIPKTPTDKNKIVEHSFSPKSKTKIVNKMTAWTRANQLNKKKTLYNFITLTLTSKQIGTDKDFTKMLNVFFTYCRKYYNLKNYLYVLERQNRTTNNIHAHIIIDQYVNYERLNSVWCKVLGDNGYTFPQKNYLTGEVEQINTFTALKNYASENCKNYTGNDFYINPRTGKPTKPTKNLSKPNPCDVETIFNIKTVARYVTKYITKNDSKINTSLWNCSQSISRLWTGAIVNPLLHFGSLSTVIDRVITVKLDNGYILLVNLLKYYTKIQADLFAINKKIILN